MADLQGVAAPPPGRSTSPTPTPPHGMQDTASGMPSGGGPAAPPSLMGLMQQAPQERPAPSHEQTVAALRHFSEIEKHLGTLLKDPAIGKKNMRADIFAAGAAMLGDGFTTLPTLMQTLKDVPEDGPGQKKWIEAHMRQAAQAKAMVLADHARSEAGEDMLADFAAATSAKGGVHVDHMSSLMGSYGPKK